jgi:hypothetical protein
MRKGCSIQKSSKPEIIVKILVVLASEWIPEER